MLTAILRYLKKKYRKQTIDLQMGGLHVECDCEMKRESIIIGLLVGSTVLTFKLGSLF